MQHNYSNLNSDWILKITAKATADNPNSVLTTSPTTLYICMHELKNIKLNKISLPLVKSLLSKGADPDCLTGYPNYGLKRLISIRSSMAIFELFLPYYKDTLNFKEGKIYQYSGVLESIISWPNYNKFRVLLCHGLTIHKTECVKLRCGYNSNPSIAWRKNQHKRKMVADITAWPVMMMIYCLEKKKQSPFILAYK